MAAVAGGRCVDTTMGFTPLEGLVMATHSGSIDPGLLLWFLEHAGLSLAEVSEGLEHRSGLAGLAGTAGMRDVLVQAADGDTDARLAFNVCARSVSAHVAAMATSPLRSPRPVHGVDRQHGGAAANATAHPAMDARRLRERQP